MHVKVCGERVIVEADAIIKRDKRIRKIEKAWLKAGTNIPKVQNLTRLRQQPSARESPLSFGKQ